MIRTIKTVKIKDSQVMERRKASVQVAKRRKVAVQARSIAISNDGLDISQYAERLEKKWIDGKISIDERKQKLLESYRKKW